MVTIRTDGRVGDISQGDAARTSIMSEETGRLHVGEELGVTACLSPARRVVAKVVDATRVPATRDSELARLLRVSQDANCNWHGQSDDVLLIVNRMFRFGFVTKQYVNSIMYNAKLCF